MDDMFRYFENAGWGPGVDLYAASYDWRRGPQWLDYGPLVKGIEGLVERTGQRVVLLGYSQGGAVLHYLLTQVVGPQWKARYVDRLVCLSPSWGGTIAAWAMMWRPRLPWDVAQLVMHGAAFDEWMRSMAGSYQLMPHTEVFGSTAIVVGEGGSWTARSMPDLLKMFRKIERRNIPIFEGSIGLTRRVLEDPNVPTYVVWNEGIPTPRTFNFSRGFGAEPEEVFGAGDGTLTRDGMDWACRHWKLPPGHCHAFNESGKVWRHANLQSNPAVLEKIRGFIDDEDESS